MKKTLAFILTVIFCLLMVSAVSAEELEVNCLYGTPEIDGVLDEMYLGSAHQTMEDPGFFVWGDYSGEFDLQAEAYYLWDENYLYVCTIVTDDDVMDVGEDRYEAEPANWQADAVENWFDESEGKWKTHADAFGHMFYARNNGGGGEPPFTDDKVIHAVTITDTGYITEYALPMTENHVGGYISTSIQVNDQCVLDDGYGAGYASGSQNVEMFLEFVNTSAGGGSAPAASSSDAPDYVTDGLAAWYDGANNAAGSQDKAATVWKDSSGHGLDFEVELNDTNYWTDKAFHIDSTRNYLPDELVDLVNGDTYTLEFAAGELVYPATDWVSLIISDNDHFSLFIRVSNDNLEYKYNDANKDRPMADNGADLVNNSTVAISFDINSQDCWMYVDGELLSENVPIDTNIADTLMLGHDDAKRIWSGDVYAMRFYDRVLTPEEIAKNAAADNARFRSDAAPAPFGALTPTSSPAAPAEPTAPAASAYPASGESGNFMMGTIIGNETGWDGTASSGAASAFDGKAATFFDPLGVGDGFCGMEFDEPYILEKVAILSRATFLDRFNGASIEGSNDGEEWETLWESEEEAPSETEYNIVTEFENNYGYKMFRYINWINHGDVAEVEFYGKPGTAERPAEEPKAEEPAAEEPKAEEPAEESKAEEPAEEPKAEEPAADTPAADTKPAETAKSGCGAMIGGGFIVLVTVLGSA
ncbi:MAG: hypothetical protein J6Q17_00665, partial [Clostridia bacterium]|nr:hypothetical protein [Clostridia bacterium]